MDTITLNSGVKLPRIGFGTWEITPNEAANKAVTAALSAGYRLIDTAHIYGNEQGVGEALAASMIPRNELFVTTKLWNDDQGYDRTMKAITGSLEALGLDYIDLYLIHWPATTRRDDSWKAFEELHRQGLIKAAGVSNYTVDHLKQLLESSSLMPAVNQVEFHPFIYDQQQEVLNFCRDSGIVIEAYSPISRLGDTNTTVIHDIATRLSKSPQQVILRWCLQQGTVPLPRSTNSAHIASNLDIFDFELSDADMAAINQLSDGKRVTWDPAEMG